MTYRITATGLPCRVMIVECPFSAASRSSDGRLRSSSAPLRSMHPSSDALTVQHPTGTRQVGAARPVPHRPPAGSSPSLRHPGLVTRPGGGPWCSGARRLPSDLTVKSSCHCGSTEVRSWIIRAAPPIAGLRAPHQARCRLDGSLSAMDSCYSGSSATQPSAQHPNLGMRRVG